MHGFYQCGQCRVRGFTDASEGFGRAAAHPPVLVGQALAEGGHGIGRIFHDEPQISHYRSPGPNPRFRSGMTFTIEPMVNLGTWRTRLLGDGWTVKTVDDDLSAQFEHTVGVTETGCEVFTYSPAGLDCPVFETA